MMPLFIMPVSIIQELLPPPHNFGHALCWQPVDLGQMAALDFGRILLTSRNIFLPFSNFAPSAGPKYHNKQPFQHKHTPLRMAGIKKLLSAALRATLLM